MNFEQACKLMYSGYYVSRNKWGSRKLLYIADGHLCEMSNGPIKKADFIKAKITFDDFSANDWTAVKLKRKGKEITIFVGYQKYDMRKFTRLMAKVSPLSTKEVLVSPK